MLFMKEMRPKVVEECALRESALINQILGRRVRIFCFFYRLNGDAGSSGTSTASEDQKPRRPYVKKPLNAFMLFMKEMRQKVVEECTLKESAAINQILGRKVKALRGRCNLAG